MSVRPNIQSPIKLEGGMLKVHGESTLPLFSVLQIVVVQQEKAAAGTGVASGGPERTSANWTAELTAADIGTGPAEALGVEIRVDPFQVTSWSQSVQIQ